MDLSIPDQTPTNEPEVTDAPSERPGPGKRHPGERASRTRARGSPNTGACLP